MTYTKDNLRQIFQQPFNAKEWQQMLRHYFQATELSKQRDPKGFNAQKKVAKDGGSVAKAARNQLESKLGHSIISSAKASDYLLPEEPKDEQ